MMLHQDGSSHEWVPGRWWDLIVTMDDATSDIYSAFFVAEEGTMSSFQGVSEAIRAKGLEVAARWHTPTVGGHLSGWNTAVDIDVASSSMGSKTLGIGRIALASDHHVEDHPGLLARGQVELVRS